MPYYQCTEHGKAYATWRQFHGHWLNRHKGEELPQREDVEVEEPDEGVEIAPPPEETPWGQRARRRRQEEPEPEPEPVAYTPQQEHDDEDAQRLEHVLLSLGVPERTATIIVNGWRNLSVLRLHPQNLHTFIERYLPARLRPLIPIIVHEMFQNQGQEEPEAEGYYLYGQQPQAASYPYAYSPRYPSAPWVIPTRAPQPRAEASREYEHVLEELREQVRMLQEELRNERMERERELREREIREKERMWEQRFQELQRGIMEMARAITEKEKEQAISQRDRLEQGYRELSERMMELTRAIAEREKDAAIAEARERQEVLAEELRKLGEELKAERESRLMERQEQLQRYIEALRSEIVSLQSAVKEGQTGRTVEDLLAQVAPAVLDKVDRMGEGIKDELKGLREQVGQGKVPVQFTPPQPQQQPPPQSPVQEAERIAEVVRLEQQLMDQLKQGG